MGLGIFPTSAHTHPPTYPPLDIPTLDKSNPPNIPTLSFTYCCDMGQNDTIGKTELIPLFVLSSDNTNCKNDIQ